MFQSVRQCCRLFVSVAWVACLALNTLLAEEHQRATRDQLWALDPLQESSGAAENSDENPIDRLLGEAHQKRGLTPIPLADKATLLRRVSFDLVGLPPTIEQQDAFLNDSSEGAYGNLVDRLLADSQHGVRYARHWLDVLRYADVDEGMPAGSSLYLWRDWVIGALNRNLSYDAFVRTQISGLEVRERTSINALGYRSRRQPRIENMFALGFLSRGATSKGNGDHSLSISAVETISTAFLGMTVACAKCHDHFYDPISQKDFYQMKALFDPLILREIPLATVPQIVGYGEALRGYESQKSEIDSEVTEIEKPYRDRLYEERVQKLTKEIQAIIRKPDSLRTPEEQKIADDYFPVLRIDVGKIREVMPKEVRDEYDAIRRRLSKLKKPSSLPSFLTVEEDPKRLETTRYVLNSGEASRPEKDKIVQPGFLFEPEGTEFRDGLRETFVDWLTGGENALFVRVAVNRIWQWHFGKGLSEKANDFGSLSREPKLRAVLDALAREFVEHDFDMKWLHKRIVTSKAYQRASTVVTDQGRATMARDLSNDYYWRYPLRRLEAEPIHDALLALADRLDLGLGGPSFQADPKLESTQRRAIYLKRGFRSRENLLPEFLDAFDAEDGRESCARRNQTVTAPQALWLMNNPLVQKAVKAFGERIEIESSRNLLAGIQLGYRMAVGREPSSSEIQVALGFMEKESNPFEKLAWLLVNLDEFIYIR